MMTEQEFCKKYSEHFGEQVDDIRQIEFHEFNGSELYEFAQTLVNKNALLHSVSHCLLDYHNWYLSNRNDVADSSPEAIVESYLKSNGG